MDFFNCGSSVLAYKIFGSGKITVVIDTCIGSCSAEWWHIAELLAGRYTVVVYDRAGYGKSSLSKLSRTPRNIAVELNKLLTDKGINRDIIIVGHSQGGLYAAEYAAMYSSNIKGMVLLDPATPFDYIFKERLTDKEYKSSGVDKTASYKMGKTITSLGLGFLLKPMLKQSPPFCYHDFTDDTREYLLKSLFSKNTYITALEEYQYTHNEKDTEDIINAINNRLLGNIPVRLITHSSEVYIKELEYYGNMDEGTALKIEDTWQEIMKRYMSVSLETVHSTAKNSGHYIHLTDYELLENVIADISH